MLVYHPTPLQKVSHPLLDETDVQLWVKREDMNHPMISGNKWWKLRYNLSAAIGQEKKTLLTFGGAFSNHILATAAASREIGMSSIGVIRGEERLPLNPVLRTAAGQGMQLHFVSRADYRKKTSPAFIENLHTIFGDFYLIPEGGTNAFALQGVMEFARRLCNETIFSHICCAVGTGGTLAGLVNGSPHGVEVIGIPVLRGGELLSQTIGEWVHTKGNRWWLADQYHHGGYARTSPALDYFIKNFHSVTGVPLDPVYTGKMMFGLFDLLARGIVPSGSRVVALHTGGLLSSSFSERL